MHVLTVDYTASHAPEQFCKSLKETGFGVLSHYSDLAHRKLYQHQKPTQDGYFPFRTENAKDNKISDLKEFFHYYPWGKIPPELKGISEEMYIALNSLAAELLQWVEDMLPEQVAAKLSMPLREMIVDSPNTLLRILHYPALAGDFEPGAVRAAAHEDINLITLLPSATAPGLEVLDTKGNWHPVSCDPGNIVVNVGD
jgi:isopenicillin N synthase-like dioxygenase